MDHLQRPGLWPLHAESLKKYYLLMLCFFTAILHTNAQNLGNGFYDHGVTSPISNHRGTVATTGRNGEKVVLMLLMDHRGGYCLLEVNVETGKSQQFPVPFPPGDAPYASLLSSKNRFYTLFNNHFAEFDPMKDAFTFEHTALPSNTMAMTEDEQGVIWAATYPKSGLISFNPQTKEFKDYGYLYKQNWNQYPRFIARDKSGWIYYAIGNAASQIIAFDPATGKVKEMLKEAERKRGIAYLYLNLDGKVYGQALEKKDADWYEFSNGERQNIGKHHTVNAKPIITGNQGLFYNKFPDGSLLKSANLLEKTITYYDAASKTDKTVQIEYTSDGAWTMGVAATQYGKLAGGTSFPMRFFSYDPKKDTWVNLRAFGQFNALSRAGNKFYFGVYPSGELLEWDPAKPWVDTKPGEKTNPFFLAKLTPIIHRPFRLLPVLNNKTIIMSGSPEYGYTGGGLLFWDIEKKQQTVLKDSAVIPDQSTISMVTLPGNKFLGGTTTAPGTGGEKKANLAELYCMDITSKHIDWHIAPIPGVQEYSDLCKGPDNLIYGITDKQRFFVFDPAKKAVVYEFDPKGIYGNRTAGEQSPRIFVTGPGKEIYILFEKAIVKVDPVTFKLNLVANSPVIINTGGDYLDGKIYFVSGSHLCSYKL
ncbi:NHL repeat-containing protein [Mucilaginibacter boryungensis]|uniref:Pyrroloquinoline-quinone binding quinoprotein n=1 Tax=Mucilaginibacter boryungensis TaxID=768480 RepID=A0ABR9XDZ5_9SPHI|nr:hypothetical protein [Mucilaginibacter boryungensis]MBE9665476.1 hypothetical protein [Mucilaginibacter boryungensis]